MQRSFLLDLQSYHDYQVCIAELISLAKRRFFVATRTLWCSILAFVSVLSFRLILSRISCTHDPYLRLLKILRRKISLLHIHYSVVVVSLLLIFIRGITLLEALVSISGSVWVEKSYVKQCYLTCCQDPLAAISNLVSSDVFAAHYSNSSPLSFLQCWFNANIVTDFL